MTDLADFLKQEKKGILRELRGCGEELSELYKLLCRKDNEDDDKVTTGFCIWGIRGDAHRLDIKILSDDLNYLERVIISEAEKWQRVGERKYQSGNTCVEFEEKSRGTTVQISYRQIDQFKNKDYCDKVVELLDEVITKMYGLERQKPTRPTSKTAVFEQPIDKAESKELAQLAPDDLYQKIVKIAFNIQRKDYLEAQDGEASLFDGNEPGTTQLALKVKRDNLDMSRINFFLRKQGDDRYTVLRTADGFSIKITYQSMPQRTDLEAAEKYVKDILNIL
jgi:predicted DNA binding CopG/RHH family protein